MSKRTTVHNPPKMTPALFPKRWAPTPNLFSSKPAHTENMLCHIPQGSHSLVVWHGRLASVCWMVSGGGCLGSPFSTGGMFSILHRGHILQTFFSKLSGGVMSHPQCLRTASCLLFPAGHRHAQSSIIVLLIIMSTSRRIPLANTEIHCQIRA